MIHSKFIGVDEINALKAQNKIRETPDIIIFGGKRRRICKLLSRYAWITHRASVVIGYGVIDLDTDEIY